MKQSGTIAALIAIIGVFLVSSASAQSSCTCRYAGTSYSLDSCVCMSTPNGVRRACCGLVLNNTSWKFTNGGCPTASAPADALVRTEAKADHVAPAQLDAKTEISRN